MNYMGPLAAAIRADVGVEGLLVPGSGGLRVKDTVHLAFVQGLVPAKVSGHNWRLTRASGAVLNLAKFVC